MNKQNTLLTTVKAAETLAKQFQVPTIPILESFKSIQQTFSGHVYKNNAIGIYANNLLSIIEYWQKYTEGVKFLAEDFKTAQNTYYCKVQEEELQLQEDEINNLNAQNKELQAYIIGLEKTIKEQARIIGRQFEKQAGNNYNRLPTLYPNITPLQVSELWKRLRHIFKGDLKHFARLFDENITEEAPPIISPTIADAAALVYFLRKYNIIASQKPFAVLEKIKAFEYKGKIITSKQFRHALENKDLGGYIGGYYSAIEEAIITL